MKSWHNISLKSRRRSFTGFRQERSGSVKMRIIFCSFWKMTDSRHLLYTRTVFIKYRWEPSVV